MIDKNGAPERIRTSDPQIRRFEKRPESKGETCKPGPKSAKQLQSVTTGFANQSPPPIDTLEDGEFFTSLAAEGRALRRLKPDGFIEVKQLGDVIAQSLAGKIVALPIGAVLYLASLDHVRETADPSDLIGYGTLIVDRIGLVRFFGHDSGLEGVRAIVTAYSFPLDGRHEEAAPCN